MNELLIIFAGIALLIYGFNFYLNREVRGRKNSIKVQWPKGSTIRWRDPDYGIRRGNISKYVFYKEGDLSGFWVDTTMRPRKGPYDTYTNMFVPFNSYSVAYASEGIVIESPTPATKEVATRMAEILDRELPTPERTEEVEEERNFWDLAVEGDDVV